MWGGYGQTYRPKGQERWQRLFWVLQLSKVLRNSTECLSATKTSAHVVYKAETAGSPFCFAYQRLIQPRPAADCRIWRARTSFGGGWPDEFIDKNSSGRLHTAISAVPGVRNVPLRGQSCGIVLVGRHRLEDTPLFQIIERYYSLFEALRA